MEHSVSRLQASTRGKVPPRLPFKRHAPTRHALLLAQGGTQCPSVRSVSRSGIKLDGAFGLQPGDAVSVRLASQRMLDGTVDWAVAGFCGIRFTEALAENDPALTLDI